MAIGKYHIPNLREDEEILLVTRRHWLYLVIIIALLIMLILLIPAFYLFFKNFYPQAIKTPFQELFIFLSSLYLIFVWLSFFLKWLDFYLDTWIVTSERILDIEQFGLFKRETSEFPVRNVQDVTVEVKGFLATLLEFGSLKVQTAGEEQTFIFWSVPNPYKIKDTILQAQKECLNQHQHSTPLNP